MIQALMGELEDKQQQDHNQAQESIERIALKLTEKSFEYDSQTKCVVTHSILSKLFN